MEAEAIRGWGADSHPRSRDVPTVAGDIEDRSLVSEHGSAGSDRIVLCDGDIQVDSVLRHCFHGTARTVAVPESV